MERSFIRGLVTGLERDLPVQEQAEPMTIEVLRQLGAAVTTAKDLLVVRTLVGAVFQWHGLTASSAWAPRASSTLALTVSG